MNQTEIDALNAEFWSELCGSGLARYLGITETTPESLRKFDSAFMGLYPYLDGYVAKEALTGKRVLEIGLGYGTLGEFLAKQGCEYVGLDIAPTPVTMMRYRLNQMGQNGETNVKQGSALEIPFEDTSFDYVYSIGCLHHTGDIPSAVDEVYRVLKPGGRAIIMLYNKHSFRQFSLTIRRLFTAKLREEYAQAVRAAYDTNAKGEAAPHTDYVSWATIRQLFKKFNSTHIDFQNFDNLLLTLPISIRGRRSLYLPRELFLNNVGRTPLGLEFYVVAQK